MPPDSMAGKMKRLTFFLFVLLFVGISLNAVHCHADGMEHPSCLLCMVSFFLPAPGTSLTDSGTQPAPDVLPVSDSTLLPTPPGTMVHFDRAPPGSTGLRNI
jgi:hypothetical protein